MPSLIGSQPNQIPTNNLLGKLAFLDNPPDKSTLIVSSFSTSTTNYINIDLYKQISINAQSGALLFSNPVGTPNDGDSLIIRIKDNGVSANLTYGTQYRAVGTTLTSATTINKVLYMYFLYNKSSTKWDLVYKAQEV